MVLALALLDGSSSFGRPNNTLGVCLVGQVRLGGAIGAFTMLLKHLEEDCITSRLYRIDIIK